MPTTDVSMFSTRRMTFVGVRKSDASVTIPPEKSLNNWCSIAAILCRCGIFVGILGESSLTEVACYIRTAHRAHPYKLTGLFIRDERFYFFLVFPIKQLRTFALAIIKEQGELVGDIRFYDIRRKLGLVGEVIYKCRKNVGVDN